MMTNDDLEGRISLSYPHTSYGLFFFFSGVQEKLLSKIIKELKMSKYNRGLSVRKTWQEIKGETKAVLSKITQRVEGLLKKEEATT